MKRRLKGEHRRAVRPGRVRILDQPGTPVPELVVAVCRKEGWDKLHLAP